MLKENSKSEISSYYKNTRQDIAQYIKKGQHVILDIGCGAGNLGEFLKKNAYAKEVIGVELDLTATAEASTKLDSVINANLNLTNVTEVLRKYNKESFDYIVCADVLEHLVDPWNVLNDLRKYLKPGGHVVISLPNVRHWSVWLPLILRGRWEYCDSGIMDRTHLRFFTLSSAIELLKEARLDVVTYRPLLRGKSQLISKYSMGLFNEIIAVQTIFIGTPKIER
jgi:methionine biosynthesis protein MetW